MWKTSNKQTKFVIVWGEFSSLLRPWKKHCSSFWYCKRSKTGMQKQSSILHTANDQKLGPGKAWETRLASCRLVTTSLTLAARAINLLLENGDYQLGEAATSWIYTRTKQKDSAQWKCTSVQPPQVINCETSCWTAGQNSREGLGYRHFSFCGSHTNITGWVYSGLSLVYHSRPSGPSTRSPVQWSALCPLWCEWDSDEELLLLSACTINLPC